jgi:hypothetical protein
MIYPFHLRASRLDPIDFRRVLATLIVSFSKGER